mmetsp:Transcript_18134/g.32883  ORF Transcript_18134/g.32883 Transcript_18134/m.32883 type:complete len:271 (+) Transcript_18134:357-1169(+)
MGMRRIAIAIARIVIIRRRWSRRRWKCCHNWWTISRRLTTIRREMWRRGRSACSLPSRNTPRIPTIERPWYGTPTANSFRSSSNSSDAANAAAANNTSSSSSSTTLASPAKTNALLRSTVEVLRCCLDCYATIHPAISWQLFWSTSHLPMPTFEMSSCLPDLPSNWSRPCPTHFGWHLCLRRNIIIGNPCRWRMRMDRFLPGNYWRMSWRRIIGSVGIGTKHLNRLIHRLVHGNSSSIHDMIGISCKKVDWCLMRRNNCIRKRPGGACAP